MPDKINIVLTHHGTHCSPEIIFPFAPSPSLFPCASSTIIRENLISHNTNPQQEHLAHKRKGKHSLPLLTYTLLFQPSQCLQRLTSRILAEDGEVAVTADPASAPELDGDDDESHEPEDEQDEAAYQNDGGEEAAVVDEVEEDEDEDYAETGYCYGVAEIPEDLSVRSLYVKK
jgi:hypothetical protein